MILEGLMKTEWKLQNNIPTIFLFLRNENKERIIKTITTHKNYFYTSDKSLPSLVNVKYEKVNKKTLFGNYDVTKVILNNPSQIYNIVNKFKTNYESDVSFMSRFLIDEVDTIHKQQPLILFFDIETTSFEGFPEKDNPKEKIISIAYTHSFTDKTFILLLKPDNKEIKNDLGLNIKTFDNEKEMLMFFMKVFKKLQPDVLTAWNVRFDINYLLARMSHLNIKYNPYMNVIKTNKHGDVDIWGCNVFDLLQGFKKIYLSEMPSYSLDYVSKELLSEKDNKIKILNIGDTWKINPYEIAVYNVKDVDIIKKLDTKVKIIDYWLEVMHLGFLSNLQQCLAFSYVLDNIILKKFKNEFVFPSKSYKEKQKIGGGYVKTPDKGLHEWVYVFDYSAMYPTIMKTFNLSKDTVVDDEEDYVVNDVKWKSENSRKGIMPQILEDMINLRSKYKKEMNKYSYDTYEYNLFFLKQFAMKFLVNSSYGVNAFPSFRLYDSRVADTITFCGRTIIQYVAQQIEERNKLEIVYQDTDSIFIKVGKEDYDIIENLERDLNKYTEEIINTLSNNKAKNYMKIELEKIFDKLLVCEKKRYIGRITYNNNKKVEPTMKNVGVDLKRNNISPIIKRGLNEYVKVLFEKNKSELKTTVNKYNELIRNSKNIEDFATPTKIEKIYQTNVPQQRAADFANKKWNLGFKPGSKFYSVKVRGLPETDIIGFDVPERVKEYSKFIDKNEYLLQFKNKIKLIYDNEEMEQSKLLSW